MSTDKLYDPLRRKEVAATPEEQVRQWFIGVLRDSCGVPAHLMMSEAGLKLGAKSWRTDLLVYDRCGLPLAVVEFKRPDVAIDAGVAAQAMRYNQVLDVQWIILTNGNHTLVFRREGGRFVPYNGLPKYEEMICRL